MSDAITFDTLKFAKRLTGHGVPAEQAEALAEGLGEDLVSQINTNLAAKSALEDLVTKRDLDVALLRHEVKQLKWAVGLLIGFFVTFTGINLAAMFGMLQIMLQPVGG